MSDKEPETMIDLTFLKEFCKENREKMATYIHMFLESAPEQMESMKSNASAGNWNAVKAAAHSLKPQLTFMGLGSVQPVIELIESDALTLSASDKIPLHLTKLEKLLEQSFNELIQSLVSLA